MNVTDNKNSYNGIQGLDQSTNFYKTTRVSDVIFSITHEIFLIDQLKIRKYFKTGKYLNDLRKY